MAKTTTQSNQAFANLPGSAEGAESGSLFLACCQSLLHLAEPLKAAMDVAAFIN